MTTQIIQISSWFLMILFSLIIYTRILNINNISILVVFFGFVLAATLSIIFIMLIDILPQRRIIIAILVITVFEWMYSRIKFDISLMASLLSIGISFGMYLIAVTISNSLIFTFAKASNDIIALCLSFIIQSVIILCLFNSKRLKKGILFLHKKNVSSFGLILCGVILLVFALIRDEISAELGMFLLAGVFLCLFGLYFWWHIGLTIMYRENIRKRNIENYENELLVKNRIIMTLQEDNETMSRLIHRDNKILPTLHTTIKRVMEDGMISKMHAGYIISQIDQLLKEREGIAQHTNQRNMPYIQDNNLILSDIFCFMQKQAADQGILLDYSVDTDLFCFFNSMLSVLEFKSLCADLMENAIIATIPNALKKISLNFNRNNGIYKLCVSDSGIPFEIETLINLGRIKCSTHLSAGGSGIGYMNIFSILHENNASLIITEYAHMNQEFTKSIEIEFDGRNAYIIQTYRAEALSRLCQLKNIQNNRPLVLHQLL